MNFSPCAHSPVFHQLQDFISVRQRAIPPPLPGIIAPSCLCVHPSQSQTSSTRCRNCPPTTGCFQFASAWALALPRQQVYGMRLIVPHPRLYFIDVNFHSAHHSRIILACIPKHVHQTVPICTNLPRRCSHTESKLPLLAPCARLIEYSSKPHAL